MVAIFSSLSVYTLRLRQNCCHFVENITKYPSFQATVGQIGSHIGWAPNKQQAIILTSDGLIHMYIC